MRRALIAGVMMLICCAGSRAQQDADLVKALQKTTAKVIREHENSIACILVGRSEYYPRDPRNPGKLGVYEPSKINFDGSNVDRQALLKKLDLADPTNIPPSFGSGVVIDPQGLILTNYHVVQDAAKIFVRLPGSRGFYADIHAADPRSDLAVLKLLNANNALPLKALPLGDADKMERGQFVLTLSNPYAVGFRDGQPSASYGILSNIRRRAITHFKEEERVKPFHHYGTLLQTDARLSLGCSGGALLNLKGELIGLLTSLAAIHGVDTPGGFAVPINGNMKQIVDVLKRGEEVEYGFLGVGFDQRPGNNGNVGVTLTVVGDGSPAEVDGKLRLNDVLLAVNGQPTHEGDDVYTTIGMQLAGNKVKLHVRNAVGGKERIVDVTLAKLYVPGKRIASSYGSRPYFRGMRVDYTSVLVQMQAGPTRGIPRGVVVSDVQPKSSADNAKLKDGDVITHVNLLPVTSPAAFYQAVDNARGAIELTILNSPARVTLK